MRCLHTTAMYPKILFVLVVIIDFVKSTSWSREIDCPTVCTCREEHFSDLAIARYTRHISFHLDSQLLSNRISNEVLYDDDDDIKFDKDNPLLRIATCFLQAETNLENFITTLPKSVQALSLIKSSDSGNKTLRLSYLDHFDDLVSFELQGSASVHSGDIDLIMEIDVPLISLKYLNLDTVKIKNSKSRQEKLQEIINQKKNTEIRLESISMVEKKDQESEILPYYKYKEIQKNLESSFFVEFNNLVLIRMSGCNLQSIHWEMFENLSHLKYLILEKNNLKFVPNFAFYGTPNLNTLSLAWNNLLNIQIADLAGLLELEYLDLSHNNFSQLSELSFPPFPKLKVADFRDNPITVVYPNTFDIMNTTDSIILGNEEIGLQLLPNSFLGLNELIKLTISNIDVPILQQELLTGMPVLKELTLSGKVPKIEYDAFLELRQLEKLVLNHCNIYNISMDSFYGLDNLLILDLSNNHLQSLPPNTFDEQKQLKELMLNGNELKELPVGIFNNIPVKLLRLNENPWHCSCAMSDWDPMIINKIKTKASSACDSHYDKGLACVFQKKFVYMYENRMAPKCSSPNKVKGQSVFQAIRKPLHCRNLKMKLRKPKVNSTDILPVERAQNAKNIIGSSDFSNLKNIEMKTNQEPNDLNIDFDQTHLVNQQIAHSNVGKTAYNKKKKQQYLLMKLKRAKKERKETMSLGSNIQLPKN